MEPDGTVVVLVLLLVLVVRGVGYPSEPWWSRWASAVILAGWTACDLLGLGVLVVPAAVLFVVSLVVHVSWRFGEGGRPWRMPIVGAKSRGDVP